MTADASDRTVSRVLRWAASTGSAADRPDGREPEQGPSRGADADLFRRSFLSGSVLAVLSMAGCLGSDDDGEPDTPTPDVDREDFEDEAQYSVAVGVASADHELGSIARDEEGWIEATIPVDVELDEHVSGIPSGIPTPTPGEPVPPRFRGPPTYRPVIDGYIEAVRGGEDGAGIRVTYDDGRCLGTFFVQRRVVDWYLNDTLDRDDVYYEATNRYETACED